MAVDPDRPSTWMFYKHGMCDGCRAHCCTLPVEATASDLVRMGVAAPDQITGSLKKLARALERAGIVRHFRASSGLFMLVQKPTGECMYLGADRRCTIYETRPDVCRRFPSIGPRPGYCPSKRQIAAVKPGAGAGKNREVLRSPNDSGDLIR